MVNVKSQFYCFCLEFKRTLSTSVQIRMKTVTLISFNNIDNRFVHIVIHKFLGISDFKTVPIAVFSLMWVDL